MSAFNAKKLSYTKQEPTFLRKLREQHGGDRSTVKIARPAKNRIKTTDGDEDEPTIVDEHGETMGRDEWEQRLKKMRNGSEEVEDVDKADGKDRITKDGGAVAVEGKNRQQVAEASVSKKRKAGKMVGAEEEDQQDEGRSEKQNNNLEKSSTVTDKKKKLKKVKLSFDEPD
jgi:hypothetical protein